VRAVCFQQINISCMYTFKLSVCTEEMELKSSPNPRFLSAGIFTRPGAATGPHTSCYPRNADYDVANYVLICTSRITRSRWPRGGPRTV